MINLKLRRSSGSGNSVLHVFGRFNSFKSRIKNYIHVGIQHNERKLDQNTVIFQKILLTPIGTSMSLQLSRDLPTR